jgi:transposase
MEPLTLTGWQRRRLERQLRAAHDARLYRRTLAVLEVARGRPVAEVAAALGVTRHSVYNWVAAYAAEHDPAALREGDHTGRPSLWTEGYQERLRALLGQSPQDLGYAATGWTVPLLQEHLEHCTGQWFADDTLRRELQRQRYVWRRARYVLDPDPELEKKTADPPPGRAAAAPERAAGRGRDRPAAVPALARRLGPARPAQGSAPERPQCAAGGVRGPEPADG